MRFKRGDIIKNGLLTEQLMYVHDSNEIYFYMTYLRSYGSTSVFRWEQYDINFNLYTNFFEVDNEI